MTAITDKSVKKGSSFAQIISRYWLLAFTVLVMIAFGIAEPRFFRTGNLFNIISASSVTGIAAIGMSLVLAAGEIDYTVGASLSCSACLMAVLLDIKGFDSYGLALVVTFVAMIAIALMNCFVHIKIGVPAFIATLGVNYLVSAFNSIITNNTQVFSARWPACFTFLGQYKLFGSIPMPAVCMIVVSVAAYIYTEHTPHGTKMYACGANNVACQYCGINVKVEKMKSFILCAVLCGFAGIIQGSILRQAGPTLGSMTLLNGFTTCFLGATFYRVGMFNVPGTILGAVLVSIINNGMTMVGADTSATYFVQGFVMLASVVIVTLIRKRNAKKG